MKKLTFSTVLYKYRKAHRLTQEDLAEHLNISTRWYQNLESGKKLPGNDLMLNLIAYLGIDGRDLRDEGDIPPDEKDPMVALRNIPDPLPSKDVLYQYSLVRDTLLSPESGCHQTYGIDVDKLTAEGCEFYRRVSDISTDRRLVQKLVFECNLNRLLPEQLDEVIDDAV